MIVLASGSVTRRELLAAAGLQFDVAIADLDEGPIKQAGRTAGWDPGRVAGELALAKARAVAERFPGALVIGADQMLALDGLWFDKPEDLTAARTQLRRLSGATHQLISAAALVRDGVTLWQGVDGARLTMRAFSEEFLDWYLAAAGPDICRSVGAYQLEGLGIQLFERIEGDHFTILGLPLLMLLAALRREGMLFK